MANVEDIDDLEGIICARFPSMKICGCTVPCRKSLKLATLQKVIDGLYIGPLEMALKVKTLSSNGITHILDVGCQPYAKQRHFTYLSLQIKDEEQENIETYFDQTNDFINEGRRRGGVLVHCQAGISRSATLVIAYLIKEYHMSFEEGYSLVKKARDCIDPNPGFVKALQLYQIEVVQEAKQNNSFRS